MSLTAPDSLIFTDMDGTLLDHHDYSIEPARNMLHKLNSADVPVIPNTSKTFAELIDLREKHRLDGPFIVENGAAIYIPLGFLPQKPQGALWSDGYWCKSFTSYRAHWLQLIVGLKKAFEGQFIGFSDMSAEDIAAATGLSLEEAQLASQRQFGEPILFKGDDEQRHAFIEAAKARGANVLEGGRFIHICGNVNKGEAMNWLANTVKVQFALKQLPRTIALGDSGNDIAMLEQADIGIRIRSPIKPPPELNQPKGQIITSTLYGPEGWSETLEQVFTFSA